MKPGLEISDLTPRRSHQSRPGQSKRVWTCPGTFQGQNRLLQRLNGHQQALGLVLPSLTSCVVTAVHKEALLSLCLRKWQPTPVLLPGKFHGWRSLAGHSPQDHKQLDTTERLHFKGERDSPGRGIWSFPRLRANSQPEGGSPNLGTAPTLSAKGREGPQAPRTGGGCPGAEHSEACPEQGVSADGASGVLLHHSSVHHAGVAGSAELIHKEMKTTRWEVTGQKTLG